MPRSRVIIFRSEHTELTPWDLNSCFGVFCTIWVHFCIVWLPNKTGRKTSRSGAKVRAMKSCQAPNPPHWAQNSCFIAFHTILVHLGPFGCVTKLSAKRTKLMQKFVPRSRVGIFHNERNRSTPLDSKLMFWCVLYYLDAFGTVWLPYKTRCKTGRSGAKVRAKKSGRNFSQRTHPIHPIGPLPHVSLCFVLFGCIWESLLRYHT